MIVQGVKIDQEVIDFAKYTVGKYWLYGFEACELTSKLEDFGVPSNNGKSGHEFEFVASRVTGNLLRKWKKEGFVFYCKIERRWLLTA